MLKPIRAQLPFPVEVVLELQKSKCQKAPRPRTQPSPNQPTKEEQIATTSANKFETRKKRNENED